MMRPTTTRGRRALLALAVCGGLMAVFAILVAAGQRGGDEFFDNLWLTVPVLGAYLTAVLAFVLGALALATGERGLAVVLATILGFLVTGFGILEAVFPH